MVTGDVLLILACAYGPFINLYQWLEQTVGVEIVTVPLEWPLAGNQYIIDGINLCRTSRASVKQDMGLQFEMT